MIWWHQFCEHLASRRSQPALDAFQIAHFGGSIPISGSNRLFHSCSQLRPSSGFRNELYTVNGFWRHTESTRINVGKLRPKEKNLCRIINP
jgi:hypothetical protein